MELKLKSESGPDHPNYDQALAFEAPYLIEKALEEGLAETTDEAQDLFLEVKRYIVLSHASKARWEIFSHRVDEVWHNFVLYSKEYSSWCHTNFGRYMHHAPSNSPRLEQMDDKPGVDLRRHPPSLFPIAYEEFFGSPLPDVWYDERNVAVGRRAIATIQNLSLRIDSDADETHIMTTDGNILFTINLLGTQALQLILMKKPFFVREIPGNLSDDEKIGLISTMIERRLVRIY